MKIEQLYYFKSLSQTHSFNKTADDFFISPQGLNKSLKALEKEFGVRFFESDKKGTLLTDNGILFLEQATQIIEIYENLKKHYEKNSDILAEGELSIACQPRISSTFLFSPLTVFKRKYPDVNIKFSSQMTARDVFEKIKSASVDIGICILIEEDYNYLVTHNPLPFTLLRKEELFICALKDLFDLPPDYFTTMPAGLIDYTYASPFKDYAVTNSSEIISPEMQLQLIKFEQKLGNVFSKEYENYYTENDFLKIPYSPPLYRYFVLLHKPHTMLTLPEKLLIDTLKNSL